ncbi:MAG: RNA polymerase subunit sigma, partial [Rhizobium altiplani]
MTSDEIAHLISLVAIGDRKAFAVLYRETSPKLLSICLRILRDRTDAEEAT